MNPKLLILAKLIIAILHVVLLVWIFYVLGNTGSMDTLSVMLHFMGLAAYGAFLIIGTALWTKKYDYQKIS
jgi:hypothetical protein